MTANGSSQKGGKRYKVFILNHEEVMYRRAWLLPLDYEPTPDTDMFPLLGIIEVTDPMMIRNIEMELRNRTSYPLSPED